MTSEARTGEETPKKKTKKRPASSEAGAGRTPKAAAEAPAQAPVARERTEEEIADDERKLGTSVAIGIPVVTVFAASVLGVVASAGPALLVLGAGILLGTIALFWASLRTLTGDAPLAQELEHASFSTTTDAMVERKRMLLRALKDLESELAVGKIDAKDYAVLSDRFRKEIKDLMREMDDSIEPHVKKAEELVQKHFSKIGLSGEPFRNPGKAGQAKARALEVDDALPESDREDEASAKAPDDGRIRVSCSACGASNEPDARFCKGCGGALDAAPVKSTKADDDSTDDDDKDESDDEDDEDDESDDDSTDEAPAKAEGGTDDEDDGEDSGEEPEKKTSGRAKNA